MIKRECAKNPQLKNESWDKFMPKYVSKNVKKQKKEIKEKKEYTPFPPPQQPSKVDLQLGKFISVFFQCRNISSDCVHTLPVQFL